MNRTNLNSWLPFNLGTILVITNNLRIILYLYIPHWIVNFKFVMSCFFFENCVHKPRNVLEVEWPISDKYYSRSRISRQWMSSATQNMFIFLELKQIPYMQSNQCSSLFKMIDNEKSSKRIRRKCGLYFVHRKHSRNSQREEGSLHSPRNSQGRSFFSKYV